MTYKEAIEFITSSSYLGSKLGLERLQKLLFYMGNPEKRLKYIHLAGTNGKGSTAAMLSSILTCAGYKTGLFTSPFLVSYKEQLRINGVEISEEDFANVTKVVAEAAYNLEEMPTEFERMTAIAFQYFYEIQCDFVVLEVGLGGKQDATNVIPKPEVAVITNIGLDHTEYLGNTLEEIAEQKAGIIKKEGIVVSYEQENSVLKVLQETCREKKATLIVADFSKICNFGKEEGLSSFSYKQYKDLKLSLLGGHQIKNACVAIETIEALNQQGYLISNMNVTDGLQKVTWPARFELLSKEPLVYLDGGHNSQGIKVVLDLLAEYYKEKKIIIVTGVMADKDYKTMYSMLAPVAKEFIAVQPNNSRALKLETLVQTLLHLSDRVYPSDSIIGGVKLALEHAKKEDLVIIIGSLYMAGEVREYFMR